MAKSTCSKNIIAEYKPEKTKRILLCAHWDTRPWADRDSIDKYKPFDGANDGASGVAVLLEIARAIQTAPLGYGIDFIFLIWKTMGKTMVMIVILNRKTPGALARSIGQKTRISQTTMRSMVFC
ncbi:MAG: M28 family peptidase [Bacteroidetes bacterium]|nr:M28 family peptidase [Bacteroidota bacterium]